MCALVCCFNTTSISIIEYFKTHFMLTHVLGFCSQAVPCLTTDCETFVFYRQICLTWFTFRNISQSILELFITIETPVQNTLKISEKLPSIDYRLLIRLSGLRLPL